MGAADNIPKYGLNTSQHSGSARRTGRGCQIVVDIEACAVMCIAIALGT